jgi:hypothetical protein
LCVTSFEISNFSGGEGEFSKALGLYANLDERRAKNSSEFLLIKMVFIGFSLILKRLALLGFWYLIKEKRYDVMLMLGGIVLYFVLVHVYHGSPRYRVPIEPIFAILGACGLLQLGRISQTIGSRTIAD